MSASIVALLLLSMRCAMGGQSFLGTGGPSDFDDVDLEVYPAKGTSGKALLFSHLPKNAGSSIEEIGKSGNIAWGAHRYFGKDANQTQTMPDGRVCNSWHVPVYLVHDSEAYNESVSEVFCVVRDPLDRLVSEFTYRMMIDRDYFSGKEVLRYCDKRMGMNSTEQKEYGGKCTVQNLNAFLEDNLKKVDQGDVFRHDCHYVPQHDFVFDPRSGKRTCHHVLHLSNLTQEFNALMTSRRISVRMSPKSRSNERPQDCDALSVQSLSPRVRELAQKIYAKDFLMLSPSPETGGSLLTAPAM